MNILFFAVLPYIAIVLAVLFGVYRYYRYRYSFSSLSNQILENRKIFWGSVPWHYGIILILLAHLIAAIAPAGWRYVVGGPTRLFVFEALGLALAIYTLAGLLILVARRIFVRAATTTTSGMDWFLLALLLTQVAAGLGIAVFRRWGSLWYLSNAVPWLWSVFLMRPDVTLVVPLPMLIKFHIANGFVLILLYPFTRLVHIFTVPLGYLWRPYQIVVWNQQPAGIAGALSIPVGRPTAGGESIRPDGTAAKAGDPPAADADPPDDPPDDPGGDRQHPPDDQPNQKLPGHPFEIQPAPTSRRRFLTRISVIFGSIAAAIVAVPSIAFLLGLRKAPNVWRSVGRAADFAPGTTTKVAFADPSPLPWSGVTAQTAAWLRHETPGDFAAYSVDCTHLGCPIRWLPEAELFMCPCHGGVFYKDGQVASGPPGRPLVRYPLRVRNGEVEILTSPLPIVG